MTPGHAFYSPLAADVGGSLNWLFFASGNVLGAFDPGTPLETVSALWRLASADGASVESVVAAVPTRGPSAVTSFVIVVIGKRATIVVRGAGSVDVQSASGQRRIDSRNMQPWYLAEYDNFTGLTLGSAERSVGVDTGPAPNDLPLISGIVRAPWLAWTPVEVDLPTRDSGAPDDQAVPAQQAAIVGWDPSPAPRASAPTQSGSINSAVVPGSRRSFAPSAPITGSIPVQKLAVAPGSSGSAITTPIPVIPAPPRSAPAARDGAGTTADFSDTIRGSATGRGTGRWSILEDPASALVEGERQSTDPDGATGDTIVVPPNRHRADSTQLTAWNPGRMEQDPRFTPGQTDFSTPEYCGFRIGKGQLYRLDTPVYIGRKPSTPRIVTGTMPRLIRVSSPSMEVSSTHLEIRQQGSSVIVTDMRTTNGTYVVQPGADHLKLRQGDSMVVVPGTVIDIGDGNVIEIVPFPSRQESP